MQARLQEEPIRLSVVSANRQQFGYLAAASESGRNAVELVRGLIPLFLEDFECELECSSEVAFLRLRAGGEAPASRFMTEYVIGLAITMSRAPSRSRRFMRDAKTGWASVGFAPITTTTSAASTDSKVWVPADVP